MIYLDAFKRKKFVERACHDKKVKEMIDLIPTVISKDTQKAVINILECISRDIKVGRVIDNHEVKIYSRRMVEEITSNQNAMMYLEKIRKYDNYTFTHSVNVCLLSVLTGMDLNLPRQEIEELALGAILHDLGKILINESILKKTERLTKVEFEEVKHHPYNSYCIISKDSAIGEIPKLIAYQHHERYNSSGYPRKLYGNQISGYAVITALADVYDALTTDRIYRRGYLPYEATKIILSFSAEKFCPKITRAFIQNISIYPPGSLVKINTGDIGIVIKVNKKLILRPVVRLLLDSSNDSYKTVNDIDLSKELDYFIVGAVDMEIS
ncbi:MAG: HD-GYP domain-containing protein [bacterium]|nr:HD-GYP domain-containing protein [bacterium]